MSVATTPPKAPPQPIAPEPVQRRRSLIPGPLRNPWGKPRFLVAVTWTYVAWALVPVVIAILFSFNAGRSRSVWQGFSIKWWWGDPNQSVFHYAPYTQALLSVLPDATRDAPARPLTGEPPDPTKIPAGCRFHPRCPRLAALPSGDGRADLCRATPVPVLPAAARPATGPAGDSASLVACHLAELDVSDLLERSEPSPQGAE